MTAVSVKQAFKNVAYIEERIRNGAILTYGPQPRNGNLDNNVFDCSSFIGAIWGFNPTGATPGMLSLYCNNGFEVIATEVNNITKRTALLSSLKAGDVLIDPDPGDDGHTGMVSKTNTLIEFSGSGYSNNSNILYFPWTQVIRRTGPGAYGIGIKKFQPNVFN